MTAATRSWTVMQLLQDCTSTNPGALAKIPTIEPAQSTRQASRSQKLRCFARAETHTIPGCHCASRGQIPKAGRQSGTSAPPKPESWPTDAAVRAGWKEHVHLGLLLKAVVCDKGWLRYKTAQYPTQQIFSSLCAISWSSQAEGRRRKLTC